jgi:hypothetical protein
MGPLPSLLKTVEEVIEAIEVGAVQVSSYRTRYSSLLSIPPMELSHYPRSRFDNETILEIIRGRW